MKFKLYSTKYGIKKLDEPYPVLKNYNIETDGRYSYININTMEELCKLIDDLKEDIIVEQDWMEDSSKHRILEIYDTYRE